MIKESIKTNQYTNFLAFPVLLSPDEEEPPLFPLLFEGGSLFAFVLWFGDMVKVSDFEERMNLTDPNPELDSRTKKKRNEDRRRWEKN